MENTHEEGIFWGISKFWPIWEDICNTFAFNTFDDILYADTNIVVNGRPVANGSFGGHQIFCKDDFENPFFIEFRGEQRWMRPDLVYNPDIKISEKLFQYYIGINIISEKDEQIDFEVILKDQVAKYVYKKFVSALKGLLTHNTNQDAHFITKTKKFISYKRELLDKQKDKLKSESFKCQQEILKNIRYIKLKDNKTFNCRTEIFDINKHFLENNLLKFVILDWKYHDYDSFISDDKKIQKDITKQLCYEFALQQDYQDYRIESQFFIPFFYPDDYKFKDNNDIGYFIEDDLLIDRLKNNGIRVFKADFSKIQQIYLSES
jgi:hypothetical protein